MMMMIVIIMMMLDNDDDNDDDDAGLPHPVSRHGDDPGVSVPVLPCQRPGDDMYYMYC